MAAQNLLATLPDQNLTVTAGKSVVVDVDLVDVDGAAADVSAAAAVTYRATVYATGEVKVTKTLGDGVAILSATRVRITLTAADTAELGGLSLYHELAVWDALGQPSRAMSGALIVRRSYV